LNFSKIVSTFAYVNVGGKLDLNQLAFGPNTLYSAGGMCSAIATHHDYNIIRWEVIIDESNDISGHLRFGLVDNTSIVAGDHPLLNYFLDSRRAERQDLNTPWISLVVYARSDEPEFNTVGKVTFIDSQEWLSSYWVTGDKIGFQFDKHSRSLQCFRNGKLMLIWENMEITGENFCPAFSVGPKNKLTLLETCSF